MTSACAWSLFLSRPETPRYCDGVAGAFPDTRCSPELHTRLDTIRSKPSWLKSTRRSLPSPRQGSVTGIPFICIHGYVQFLLKRSLDHSRSADDEGEIVIRMHGHIPMDMTSAARCSALAWQSLSLFFVEDRKRKPRAQQTAGHAAWCLTCGASASLLVAAHMHSLHRLTRFTPFPFHCCSGIPRFLRQSR